MGPPVGQEVLTYSDLLSLVLRACVVEPNRLSNWNHGYLRLVCKGWQSTCDQLARAELKEAQLHRRLHLPSHKRIAPARIIGSALIASMAGVTRAELHLVCMADGCKNFQATQAVNSLVLRAMPALQQLVLALPTGVAGDLDRVLPRTTHLTKLEVCFPDGWSTRDGPHHDAEKAIISGLLHLQELRDLSLSDLPLEVDLGNLAPWLPPALSSLCLVFDPVPIEDVAEHELRHLGSLPALQRLQLSGCLDSHQVLPASLSHLSFLDLSDNFHPSWDASLYLDLVVAATATTLRHLDLSESRLLNYPHGLPALRGLTYLDLRGCIPEEAPDSIVLPRTLEHFAAGVTCECGEHDPEPLPDLSHLTALRHLSCILCEATELVAALPLLRRLTCLDLTSCDLSGSELQIGHLTALESLTLSSCELAAAPQGLQACARLSRLDLEGNPFGLGCTRLGFISLEGLVQLKYVKLSHCGLALFPTGVTQLAALTYLGMSGNRIPTFVPHLESSYLAAQFGLPAPVRTLNRVFYKA